MENRNETKLPFILAAIAIGLISTAGASADTCFNNLIQLDRLKGSLPSIVQNADQGIYAIANDGQKIHDGFLSFPIDKGAIAITASSAQGEFYLDATGKIGLFGGVKYPFDASDSLPQVCVNGSGQIYSSTDGVSATVTALGGGNLKVDLHMDSPVPGVPSDIVFDGRLVDRAEYQQYLDTH